MVAKGVGIAVLLLAIYAIKSSYESRLILTVVAIGVLMYLGLGKKRR